MILARTLVSHRPKCRPVSSCPSLWVPRNCWDQVYTQWTLVLFPWIKQNLVPLPRLWHGSLVLFLRPLCIIYCSLYVSVPPSPLSIFLFASLTFLITYDIYSSLPVSLILVSGSLTQALDCCNNHPLLQIYPLWGRWQLLCPSQHQGNGARPRSVSPKVEFSPTAENQEGVKHNPSLLICLSSHLSLLWLSGGRRTILEIDQCSKF